MLRVALIAFIVIIIGVSWYKHWWGFFSQTAENQPAIKTTKHVVDSVLFYKNRVRLLTKDRTGLMNKSDSLQHLLSARTEIKTVAKDTPIKAREPKKKVFRKHRVYHPVYPPSCYCTQN